MGLFYVRFSLCRIFALLSVLQLLPRSGQGQMRETCITKHLSWQKNGFCVVEMSLITSFLVEAKRVVPASQENGQPYALFFSVQRA